MAQEKRRGNVGVGESGKSGTGGWKRVRKPRLLHHSIILYYILNNSILFYSILFLFFSVLF